MDKLDKAIAEFEDERSPLTFSERFSNLRQAFMWSAFKNIKDIKRFGKQCEMSEDEQYIQEECLKQFTILEKMYMSELRANKLEGRNKGDIDRDWLKKIKDSTSTVGSIVQNLKSNTFN